MRSFGPCAETVVSQCSSCNEVWFFGKFGRHETSCFGCNPTHNRQQQKCVSGATLFKTYRKITFFLPKSTGNHFCRPTWQTDLSPALKLVCHLIEMPDLRRFSSPTAALIPIGPMTQNKKYSAFISVHWESDTPFPVMKLFQRS